MRISDLNYLETISDASAVLGSSGLDENFSDVGKSFLSHFKAKSLLSEDYKQLQRVVRPHQKKRKLGALAFADQGVSENSSTAWGVAYAFLEI